MDLSKLLTQEEIEFLKMTANNLVTQDNRGTAKPLIFKIETVEQQPVPEGYGEDGYAYLHDGEHWEEFEEFKAYLIEEREDEWKELRESHGDLYDDFEVLEMLCKQEGMSDPDKIPFKYIRNYENAFITEYGAKQHLNQNAHNLTRHPDRGNWDGIYATHGFRNPEMATIIDIILKFADPKVVEETEKKKD